MDAKLELLRSIATSLERIADALQQQGPATNTPTATLSPNLQRQLSQYPGFDWSSITATIVGRDEHGATVVRWQNQEWTRRRHADFGNDVWFSRHIETDETGKRIFARLITFANRTAARALPREVTDLLPDAPPPTPPPTPQSNNTATPPPQPAPDPHQPHTSTLDEYFPR